MKIQSTAGLAPIILQSLGLFAPNSPQNMREYANPQGICRSLIPKIQKKLGKTTKDYYRKIKLYKFSSFGTLSGGYIAQRDRI